MIQPIKFEVGRYYRTRDGRKARVLCVDAKGTYPVISLQHWPNDDDDEFTQTHVADGRVFADGEDLDDLVAEWREPIKGVAFALLVDGAVADIRTTRDAAERAVSCQPYEGIVRIRYEESPE